MKAFVDTSVLTDVLLKPGEPRNRAEAALSRFVDTLLPVYAIKEFKAGPLAYYCWVHNVFVNEQSFSSAMARVHAVSRTPMRYRTSTAIEAIATVSHAALGDMDVQAVQSKYGADTSLDKIAADEIRVGLRSVILRGWRKRRQVTTEVVNPLRCYEETDLVQERNLIVANQSGCNIEMTCALAQLFREKPKELETLRDVVKAQGESREHQKRHQALRELARKSQKFDEKKCRALGDAVFAFLAPVDATILTTNVRDHRPLAEALGKSVEAP